MIATQVPGGRELPLGKIVAVGRNYADHAREMGAVPPGEPLLFLKPSTALLPGGGRIELPAWSREVHHEVELVVRVGARLKDASSVEAGRAVDAMAVGLDLTARDVQSRAKERGEPWTIAKGFDGSAPLSSFLAVRSPEDLLDLRLTLHVNGDQRQCGNTSHMIHAVPDLLAFASSRFTLEAGDLLFTGTPAGVGPVRRGDELVARLGRLVELEVHIA